MSPSMTSSPPEVISNPNIHVLDVGASQSHWGYAGDDLPSSSAQSAWAYRSDAREWSKLPCEFLEFREHYVPHMLHAYDNLPAFLGTYLGTQIPRKGGAEFEAAGGGAPGPSSGVRTNVVGHQICKPGYQKYLEFVDNFYNSKSPAPGLSDPDDGSMIEGSMVGGLSPANSQMMNNQIGELSSVAPPPALPHSPGVVRSSASATSGNSTFGLRGGQLLVTEPTLREYAHSALLAELAFEAIGVAIFFSMRKAPLAAFSMGKPSAMVVEGGTTHTTITPVFEGYAVKQNTLSYAIGGGLLECVLARAAGLWDIEKSEWADCFCPWRFKGRNWPACSGGVHPRYLHAARVNVVREIAKMALVVQDSPCSLSPLPPPPHTTGLGAGGGDRNGDNGNGDNGNGDNDDDDDEDDEDDFVCELPDGTNVYYRRPQVEEFTEFLFQPHNVVNGSIVRLLHQQLPAGDPNDFAARYCTHWPGVAKAVLQSAVLCDIDTVPALLRSVVCSGGLCAVGGFLPRLSRELQQCSSIDLAIKPLWGDPPAPLPPSNKPPIRSVNTLKTGVLAHSPMELPMTTWIGGSMVGALSSFDCYWITKQEWAESGAQILEKRLLF